MTELSKQIVGYFRENGFTRHLNSNQTEETEHWYIYRHSPKHIDIQGTLNEQYTYIGMRLIGVKHVEYEHDIDTTDMKVEDIIKEIERQIKEWEKY